MILIALGANLSSFAGEPKETLSAALAALRDRGIVIEARSGFYLSAAWPNPTDPPFVNAVARIRTVLAPPELLTVLHDVETQFGRRRGLPNAPRSLDLDLIDYDGRIEHGPPQLPHPRMEIRRFVLLPLGDVAPEWRHPANGRRLDELLGSAPPAEITRL